MVKRALWVLMIVAIVVAFMYFVVSSRVSDHSALPIEGFGWINYDSICTFKDGKISSLKINPTRSTTLSGISARHGRVIAISGNTPAVYDSQGRVLTKLPKLPTFFDPKEIFDDLNTIYIYGFAYPKRTWETMFIELGVKPSKWHSEPGTFLRKKTSDFNLLSHLHRFFRSFQGGVRLNDDYNFDVNDSSALVYDSSDVTYYHENKTSSWMAPLFTSINFAGFIDGGHILVSYTGLFSAYSNNIIITCYTGQTRQLSTEAIPAYGPALSHKEVKLVERALAH